MLWALLVFGTLTLSVVSVVYQPVDWSERVEKFLNLLFTATVATLIGVASVHPEENWLFNMAHGRRKITVATDLDEAAFTDVVHFLEHGPDCGRFVTSELASWVSDNNYGTTQIGRPVQLNKMSWLTLAVSPRFELCVQKQGRGDESNGGASANLARGLKLSRNGVTAVVGPVSTPRDQHGYLTIKSKMLLGG